MPDGAVAGARESSKLSAIVCHHVLLCVSVCYLSFPLPCSLVELLYSAMSSALESSSQCGIKTNSGGRRRADIALSDAGKNWTTARTHVSFPILIKLLRNTTICRAMKWNGKSYIYIRLFDETLMSAQTSRNDSLCNRCAFLSSGVR